MTTDVTKSKGSGNRGSVDIFGAMRNEMERVFERFEQGWPRWPDLMGSSTDMVPSLDVREDGSQITIEVDLPGLDDKDVGVTFNNGILTIKGERKSEREEKKDNYHLAERSYGSFERSLRLPETVDENKLEAHFDKGVLKIVAQKRPEAVKTEKRIEIRKA
jgi:HSP20 family protein